jgi:hypothetical protein
LIFSNLFDEDLTASPAYKRDTGQGDRGVWLLMRPLRALMPSQLLHDRYAPITSEIGFLECAVKTAADAFQEWQHPIQSGRGVRLNRREIVGDLPTKLAGLLPLTGHEARRFLFSPTRSGWTAYFDSGWRGTDVFSTVSHLCTTIGCRGVRAVSVPHTIRKAGGREVGRSGSTIFELYLPDTASCSFLNIRRSVSAAYDGRWTFDANGEPPLEFEQLERYNARQIRDRFTPEMLDAYLGSFGIHFFSTDFYEVPQPAYLLSKEGPCAAGLKEYSLDQARTGF